MGRLNRASAHDGPRRRCTGGVSEGATFLRACRHQPSRSHAGARSWTDLLPVDPHLVNACPVGARRSRQARHDDSNVAPRGVAREGVRLHLGCVRVLSFVDSNRKRAGNTAVNAAVRNIARNRDVVEVRLASGRARVFPHNPDRRQRMSLAEIHLPPVPWRPIVCAPARRQDTVVRHGRRVVAPRFELLAVGARNAVEQHAASVATSVDDARRAGAR